MKKEVLDMFTFPSDGMSDIRGTACCLYDKAQNVHTHNGSQYAAITPTLSMSTDTIE